MRLTALACALLSVADSLSFVGSRAAALARRPVTRRLAPLAMSTAAPAAASQPVTVTPDAEVLKLVHQQGQGGPLVDGSLIFVKYEGRVVGAPVSSVNPFAKDDRFQCTVGNGQMIRGWDAALRSMQLGERATIRCGPNYGYGSEGVHPVVPPGASLEFDIEILDFRGNVFTSATFAENAPDIPRTADEIKREYQRRQALKGPEKTGFDAAWDRVSTNYVFGFFDAATSNGSPAPWYLRPSLTFPAMVGFVGLAFWIILASGAVGLKGTASNIPGELGFELL